MSALTITEVIKLKSTVEKLLTMTKYADSMVVMQTMLGTPNSVYVNLIQGQNAYACIGNNGDKIEVKISVKEYDYFYAEYDDLLNAVSAFCAQLADFDV